MSLEDPFFVVKEDVFKALNKTRGLYIRWNELQDETVCITKNESDWIGTELKNSLRSIEWDLEDLEDTIDIVEKNPTKFRIDNKELTVRKNFIEITREEVKSMKEKMNMYKTHNRDYAVRQPLLENSPIHITNPNSHSSTKYSKLENDSDSPQRFVGESLTLQNNMMRQQDEHLEAISDSLGSLKNVSQHIHVELDEQAGMLDDFGAELENTESKLDSTMKKVGKVLHLSNDRRQWMVIVLLVITLLVVILLFILL